MNRATIENLIVKYVDALGAAVDIGPDDATLLYAAPLLFARDLLARWRAGESCEALVATLEDKFQSAYFKLPPDCNGEKVGEALNELCKAIGARRSIECR